MPTEPTHLRIAVLVAVDLCLFRIRIVIPLTPILLSPIDSQGVPVPPEGVPALTSLLSQSVLYFR